MTWARVSIYSCKRIDKEQVVLRRKGDNVEVEQTFVLEDDSIEQMFIVLPLSQIEAFLELEGGAAMQKL